MYVWCLYRIEVDIVVTVFVVISCHFCHLETARYCEPFMRWTDIARCPVHTHKFWIYFLCGVVGIRGYVKISGTTLLSLCGKRCCRFGSFCLCGIVRQVT